MPCCDAMYYAIYAPVALYCLTPYPNIRLVLRECPLTISHISILYCQQNATHIEQDPRASGGSYEDDDENEVDEFCPDQAVNVAQPGEFMPPEDNFHNRPEDGKNPEKKKKKKNRKKK